MSKITVRPIRQRLAYQVGSKLYRTPLAAAKAEAWAILLARYASPVTRLQDVKYAGSLLCDCYPEVECTRQS